MDNTTAYDLTPATACLAKAFLTTLKQTPEMSFEALEGEVLSIGHKAIAKGLELALEALDSQLCKQLPQGHHQHDMKDRELATQIGDIKFSYRRVKDQYGHTYSPLAEELDIPVGARIAPGAASWLVEASTQVSYEKSAVLMYKAGGSRVSATSVMNKVKQAGALCEAEDEQAAKNLYEGGVLPDGEHIAEHINVETDGTWVSLWRPGENDPRRIEVKAVVAYDGKVRKGKKTERTNVIRHACVGSPADFWTQGVAAIGTLYDLSKVKACDLGTDGEGWCKAGPAFFGNIETTSHLDPFHVNRAIARCFSDKKLAGKTIGVIWDDGVDSAIALMRASLARGLAYESAALQAITYLENNKEAIEAEGPSLGTMESENQHLYSARMDSFPCAWSIQGASNMSRLISRSHSGRKRPRVTRANSATARRCSMLEKREIAIYEQGCAGRMVESVGSGYEYPHKASVRSKQASVQYAAALDLL